MCTEGVAGQENGGEGDENDRNKTNYDWALFSNSARCRRSAFDQMSSYVARTSWYSPATWSAMAQSSDKFIRLAIMGQARS